MKKSTLANLSLVCLLSTSAVFADSKADPQAASGPMQFGNAVLSSAEFKDLHHSGNLQLNNVKVAHSLIVNGKLNAKESIVQELTINGDSKLKEVTLNGPANINGHLEVQDSKFNGPVTIHGHLSAKGSSFKEPIKVRSTNTNFENSTLHDITIEKSRAGEKEYVNLEGTKVEGNIKFESGTGIVRLDDKSSITGKVTGGTVEKNG